MDSWLGGQEVWWIPPSRSPNKQKPEEADVTWNLTMPFYCLREPISEFGTNSLAGSSWIPEVPGLSTSSWIVNFAAAQPVQCREQMPTGGLATGSWACRWWYDEERDPWQRLHRSGAVKLAFLTAETPKDLVSPGKDTPFSKSSWTSELHAPPLLCHISKLSLIDPTSWLWIIHLRATCYVSKHLHSWWRDMNHTYVESTARYPAWIAWSRKPRV